MAKTRKRYGTRSYERSFKEKTPTQEYQATIDGKRRTTTAVNKWQARRAFEAKYGVLLSGDDIHEVRKDSQKQTSKPEPAQKPAQTTEEIQFDLFPH